MTEHTIKNQQTDDALWRRVGYGLVWGFFVTGLLGYVLISVARPDQGQASRIGLALFLAFWSSPFVGLSGAVGYHELKKHRTAADSAPVSLPIPAGKEARRPAASLPRTERLQASPN